ncbi:8203_t:CDS:2, partial [Scutellospora calospora]
KERKEKEYKEKECREQEEKNVLKELHKTDERNKRRKTYQKEYIELEESEYKECEKKKRKECGERDRYKEYEEREQKEEEKERLEGKNGNFISTTKSNNDIKIMYPIRVGMKTQVEINKKKFITHILEENKFYKNQPGYFCHCDSGSSEIEDNPTNVITSLYRQIFKTQTKILGSIIMGFDKESIFARLLHNIEFCPYSISIADKLSVMVFSLGISKKEG